MHLKVGQIYKIPIETYDAFSTNPSLKICKAKLIQETQFFYTFEYKSKIGDTMRVNIDKFKYNKNPSIIEEAKC